MAALLGIPVDEGVAGALVIVGGLFLFGFALDESLTHDLRSPMTAVRGYLQILGEEMAGPINEDQKINCSVAVECYAITFQLPA